MMGRYRHVAGEAAQASSYLRPEILAIPAEKMKKFRRAKELRPYDVSLETPSSEQAPYAEQTRGAAPGDAVGDVAGVEPDFRPAAQRRHEVRIRSGTRRARWWSLATPPSSPSLQSPKRSVRKAAFHKYYSQYEAHENTLAATLAASIQRDVYYARARRHESARAASLFHDKVPLSVYDQLIEAVHRHLPSLHRYYELRRRKMGLRRIHIYDTYVPILSDLKVRHSWREGGYAGPRSARPLSGALTSELSKRASRESGAIATRIRASKAARSAVDRTMGNRTSS